MSIYTPIYTHTRICTEGWEKHWTNIYHLHRRTRQKNLRNRLQKVSKAAHIKNDPRPHTKTPCKLLPESHIHQLPPSAPVPLFVNFVDFRRFCVGDGGGYDLHQHNNQYFSFSCFRVLFSEFRVMNCTIQMNPMHQIEKHTKIDPVVYEYSAADELPGNGYLSLGNMISSPRAAPRRSRGPAPQDQKKDRGISICRS